MFIQYSFGNLREMDCLRNLRLFYQEDDGSEEFKQACALYADTDGCYFEHVLQFQQYELHVSGRCLLATVKFEVTLIFILLL